MRRKAMSLFIATIIVCNCVTVLDTTRCTLCGYVRKPGGNVIMGKKNEEEII